MDDGDHDSPMSQSKDDTASFVSAADERFSRTELLLGASALSRLRKAFVVVAGLGAVGSYATEALARAGIGRLRLVDFDRVRPSNINRQLYALESTVGRLKADVAAERVRDINPDIEVETQPIFLGLENAGDLVADCPDALVDAIDSLSPKIHLLTASVRAGVFTVSSMGAATRLDPFAIRVGDISETRECPLARLLRKRLARRGIRQGIRCVYSLEHPPSALRTMVRAGDHAEFRRGRVRPPLGSVSFVTGIFGLIAAGEVIRAIVEKDEEPAEHVLPRLRPPRPCGE